MQWRHASVAMAVLSLSACGPLPPLPALPSAQPRVQTIGPAGGYQEVNVAIPVSSEACNANAFIEGFKADYFNRWNQLVGTKESIFALQVRHEPSNANAAWNLRLYQGKLFNLSRYDSRGDLYGLQLLASQNYNERCAANSYQMGRNAGAAAAQKAYQRLAVQERS